MNVPNQIAFRFYGDLGDFLPPDRRQRTFVHPVERRASIKDAIESIGVPHPEIDLILVGKQPVGFSYRPRPADRVAVYPRFRDLDTTTVSLVRPPPLDEPRFVLDAHLGRLARYLRVVGLDCLYDSQWADDHLAAVSAADKRILLTRDVALLKRSVVEYGHFVRHTDPRRQLTEIAARFPLAQHARPFSRCVRCNTPVHAVPRETVLDRLPPRTRAHYAEFHLCPACGQIYWKGGHYERLRKLVAKAVGSHCPVGE